MEEKYIKEYLEKINNLSEEESKQRDIYLKQIGPRPNLSQMNEDSIQEKTNIINKKNNGGIMIQGPTTNIPEIDKPWLQFYSNEEILENIPKMSIVDYIWKRNENNMNGVFADYFNVSLTYQDLKDNIDKVKASLIASGIKPYNGEGERTRIALAMPATPEAYYILLAAIDLGCVATPLDPRINPERLKKCIQNSKCEMIFSIDKFNPTFEKVAKDLNMLNKLIIVSGAQSLSSSFRFIYKLTKKIKNVRNAIGYKQFIEKGRKIDASKIKGKYIQNDPCVLEFTSGTTSEPKGAYLSNGNLVGIAHQEKSAFPTLQQGDIFLNIMPPFITYGLGCGICSALSEGLRSRLIPEFKVDDFAKLLLKYKPNIVIGVPSHYEMLIKNPELQEKNLSYLKYCIAGGDKMPVTVENKINDFFQSHGIKTNIIKGYGMTELSSVAAVNLDNDSNKVGTTGIPFVKNNIKVIDPTTNERLEIGEYGEIYESGPTTMLGYMNNPEMDKEIFKTDEFGTKWVKTGDRGKVDEDGLLTIDGRYKDTIVRPDGHNVRPTPIENIINSNPCVEKCVVIGMPDIEYESGEIPTACIVLKDYFTGDPEALIEEINSECLHELPPRDIALKYEFVENIPTTDVGKTDIKALKQMLLNESRSKIK